MTFNKNLLIAILTIALVVCGYFIIFNPPNTELLNKLQEEKIFLEQEKDATMVEIDSLREINIRTTDSLRKEELNIKYETYKEYIYPDRTIDDALIILTEYKYNPGTEEMD